MTYQTQIYRIKDSESNPDIIYHCSSLRPVVNVFLVTRPRAILEEAAGFGHYCHYLALRMLSSITKINVSILSVVCPGNVQIVQDMLR